MSGPSAVARNPEEFAAKLDQFASEKREELKKAIGTKVMLSHDPTIDIDDVLHKASSEPSADLVVMASHVPGMKEHVFASRAGYLASHSDLSVMVVR